MKLLSAHQSGWLRYSILLVAPLGVAFAFGLGREAFAEDCVSPPAGLVSWWHAEGDAADVQAVQDGTTPFGIGYAAGKVGQAFDFDGSYRRVSVPDNAAFRLTNGLTIEAWVYPRQYGGFIVFRGDNRPGLDAWTMDTYQTGYVSFQIDDAANNYTGIRAALQLNQWQHVVGTWDRAAGEVKLYVNGVLGAQTNTSVIPISALDAGSDPAVGIGNHGGTFHQFPFNGLIDEVSIYSRALSATEVEAMNAAGSAGKCAPPPPPAALVPQITSFTPLRGKAGDPVTLTGNNFSSDPGSNIVYFGAVRAEVTAASATTLSVVVPTGATVASPSVTVAGLTGQANALFVPTFSGGVAIASNSFAPKIDLPVAGNQMVVLLGDMDGDGKPDVVVASERVNRLSVYRNIGGGATLTATDFAPRVDFPLIASPYGALLADIDGDGRLDVVVGNNATGRGTTVSVFRNLAAPGAFGTNSLAPRVDFTTGTGPIKLAAADLNGDGKLDLAVATYTSMSITLLRNTSVPGVINAASFAPKTELPVGANVWDVELADVDGDGLRDVVTAAFSGGVISVFRNLGLPGTLTTNSFAAPVRLGTNRVGLLTREVAVGDIDGDLKPELVTSQSGTNTVAVFKNLSTPGALTGASFAPPVHFVTGANPDGVSLADLNGDGRLDLAVCTLPASLSVLENRASAGVIDGGTFAPRVDFPTANSPYYNAIGDLNNDGRPDIIVSSWGTSTISLLKNLLPVNQPPVADAGATDALIISPDGFHAVAVLDGSRSSDADGDALTYAWFVAGQPGPLATGVVAVVTLPVGTNSLVLTVSDGLATTSQNFSVEVITTAQAVDRLAELVADQAANPQPLLASLRAALAAIDRSQPQTAINQLNAFKNKVNAQIRPVDPALADQLIADADAIIAALNGGPALSAPDIVITSLTSGANGKPQLKIQGRAGRTHIVEASVNGVDWTPVGVAAKGAGLEYEFEDASASGAGFRFYRVVSPR